MNAGWFRKNFSYVRPVYGQDGGASRLYVFNDDVATIREEIRKRERAQGRVHQLVVELKQEETKQG